MKKQNVAITLLVFLSTACNYSFFVPKARIIHDSYGLIIWHSDDIFISLYDNKKELELFGNQFKENRLKDRPTFVMGDDQHSLIQNSAKYFLHSDCFKFKSYDTSGSLVPDSINYIGVEVRYNLNQYNETPVRKLQVYEAEIKTEFGVRKFKYKAYNPYDFIYITPIKTIYSNNNP